MNSSKSRRILTSLITREYSKENKSTARQTIAVNDKKLSSKQRDVNAIRMDEGAKTGLEASKRDVQDRIERLTVEYEAAEWDKNLVGENNHQQELESELKRLRDELVQSNKLAADRAQLEYVKSQTKETQGKLDTMKATYSDELHSILSAGWERNAFIKSSRLFWIKKPRLLLMRRSFKKAQVWNSVRSTSRLSQLVHTTQKKAEMQAQGHCLELHNHSRRKSTQQP